MGRRAKLGRLFTPPDDFAVLDVLTTKVCRVLGAPSCCLLFYEAASGNMVVISTQGVPLAKGQPLKDTRAIAQWLADTTTPLAVNDIGITQVDPSFVLVSEAKSMLWVPLFIAGRICGALAVFHLQKNAFFGSDVDILDLISSQAASVIELYLRMDEITVTDFLTGLASRPYFLERVKEESLRSERYGSPVSVIAVLLKPPDLSDTVTQRKILPEAASCLKQILRRSDVITRSGDWSFAVILSETGTAGSEVVSRKVKQELLQLVGERSEELGDIAIETKFICYPESEPDREQFVSLASSEYS